MTKRFEPASKSLATQALYLTSRFMVGPARIELAVSSLRARLTSFGDLDPMLPGISRAAVAPGQTGTATDRRLPRMGSNHHLRHWRRTNLTWEIMLRGLKGRPGDSASH